MSNPVTNLNLSANAAGAGVSDHGGSPSGGPRVREFARDGGGGSGSAALVEREVASSTNGPRGKQGAAKGRIPPAEEIHFDGRSTVDSIREDLNRNPGARKNVTLSLTDGNLDPAFIALFNEDAFMGEIASISFIFSRGDYFNSVVQFLKDETVLTSRLHELSLREQQLGDTEAKTLAQHLPQNLKILSLGNNNIGPEGVRALVDAIKETGIRLEKFSIIGDNPIGDEGVRLIMDLAVEQGWDELQFGENHIGIEGARAVAQRLPQLSGTLKIFAFNNTHIGENTEVCQAMIDAIGQCKQIERLYFYNNQVETKLSQALFSALRGHAQLREINLWNNRMGNEGARALLELCRNRSNLTDVSIMDATVTDETLKAEFEGLSGRNFYF